MDFIQSFKLGSDIEYIRLGSMANFVVKGEKSVSGSGRLLHALVSVRERFERTNVSPPTIEEMDIWIGVLDKYGDIEKLSQKHSTELYRAAHLWNDRVKKELLERPIVEINKDCSLNYKKLSNGGKDFFSPKAWGMLSDIARADLNDSARCLLVNLPTPSAMIVLRAAEDCLRHFYNAKLHRAPPKGWKAIIDNLEGNVANKALLKNLDYIRENKRNVAEHPDKRFSELEAERLFLSVVDSIEEMMDEI